MYTKVEGKEILVNVFDNETEEQALDAVYSIMGYNTRKLEDGTIKKLVSTAKETTLRESLTYLGKRFSKGFSAFAFSKHSEEELYEATKQIILAPKMVEAFIKGAILSDHKKLDEMIKSLDVEKLVGLPVIFKLISNNTLEMLDENKNLIGSIDMDTNEIITNGVLSDEQSEFITANGFEVKNSVVYLPPVVKEEKKPLQKSIKVEATVVEDSTTQTVEDTTASEPVAEEKPNGADSAKLKTMLEIAEDKLKTKEVVETNVDDSVKETTTTIPNEPVAEEVKVEVVEDEKEVTTTIINPTQTIELAHTEQVAVRINMDAIKNFVNADSLNNIPEDIKEHILLRIESAIKTLSAQKDWNKYLSTKDKYGFVKSRMFSKDNFALVRSRMMLEFKEDGMCYPKKGKAINK